MNTFNNNINKSIETYKNSSYEKVMSYERFFFIAEHLKKNIKNNFEILDIGCAKGEFFYYLKKNVKNDTLKYTGIEISEELIEIANNEPLLKEIEFIKSDARTFELNKLFDVCIMAGVLSIFDDPEPPLFQMAKHLKSGGYGYIFGGFNSNDIDVLVRYRNNYAGSNEWESGLNVFSLNTISKYLRRYSNDVKFHKFNISIVLAKDPDPIKSYTLNLLDNSRIIINGANVLRDFYLIEFKKA